CTKYELEDECFDIG
nr:immunoglobulin heavy chain junction region [Macaca mulatta]